MKTVSFKIEEDLLEVLEYLAHKMNIPKSEVIRRALKQYIKGQPNKPFITKRIKIYT